MTTATGKSSSTSAPLTNEELLSEPIHRVQWLDAATLKANTYNPNRVFDQELRLLERSILRGGWLQPIVISADLRIIDGFHRVQLSLGSKALLARYGRRVPCVVFDVPEWEAMLLTVRMNRAKGTHAAFLMADLVKTLIDVHNLDPQQIAEEIGGSLAEVELLYQNDVFKARGIAEYRYSKAWVPVESKMKL